MKTRNESEKGTVVIDASVPVKITEGFVTGAVSEDGEVAIYKGIPYAAPPVGDLRWAAPADPDDWEEVRACDRFGNIAYQRWPNFDMPWMFVYSPEFLVSEELDTRSEDCLFLNVWTKQGETDGKRPVVVYIHGGGFTEGSGSVPIYDGTHIAEDGIVFVSLNYRLGIQGFLSMEELDEESPYGTSGNYGLLDCIKALEWIRDNISAFGGDPENVTIAGQSAGAEIVNYLINTPLAKGLFENAVVFSGGFIHSAANGISGTAKKDAQAAFRKSYPDVTLEELKAVPIENLFEQYAFSSNIVIDGVVIPESNEESRLDGSFNDVNVMLGYVSGDLGLFEPGMADVASLEEYEEWIRDTFGDDADTVLSLYPAAADEEAIAANQCMKFDCIMMSAICEAGLETLSGKDAFIYLINHEAPADVPVGTFHTADVPYWLGGTLTLRAQYETDDDRAMNQTMKTYFENFITNGDPNGEGLVQWDKYDGFYRYFFIGDNTYEMVEIPRERGDFWAEYINARKSSAND